jgi:hypothetical protein
MESERVIPFDIILHAFVNPPEDNSAPTCEFVSNNSFQAPSMITPFSSVMVGIHEPLPVRGLSSVSKAHKIQEALQHAKACIKDAQHLMTRHEDKPGATVPVQ